MLKGEPLKWELSKLFFAAITPHKHRIRRDSKSKPVIFSDSDSNCSYTRKQILAHCFKILRQYCKSFLRNNCQKVTFFWKLNNHWFLLTVLPSFSFYSCKVGLQSCRLEDWLALKSKSYSYLDIQARISKCRCLQSYFYTKEF